MPTPFELFVTNGNGDEAVPFSNEHLHGTIIASGVNPELATAVTHRIEEDLRTAGIRRITRNEMRDFMSLSLRAENGFMPREAVEEHLASIARREEGGFSERLPREIDLSAESNDDDPCGPYVEMVLNEEEDQVLEITSYLSEAHEGAKLYLSNSTLPMDFVACLGPTKGFDHFRLPVDGLGPMSGHTYDLSLWLPDGRFLSGYLPPIFIPPFIFFGMDLETKLRLIREMMKTINDLLEQRKKMVDNMPYGKIAQTAQKWYKILNDIPASVWFAAAHFALCNDKALAGLTQKELKKLLRILIFHLDMQRAALETKAKLSTKEKAQLAALKLALKKFEELLDNWDDLGTADKARQAIIKLKAFLKESAAEAYEMLKDALGALAYLPMISASALWAGAHFAACNNKYLAELSTEELRQVLILFHSLLLEQIAELEAKDSLSTAEKAKLAALQKAAKKTGEALDNWNSAVGAAAIRKLLDGLKAYIKKNAPQALAALAAKLKKYAVSSLSKIKPPRFLVSFLIQQILKRILEKEVFKRIWGPVSLIISLIDLTQTGLIADDINDLDKMIARVRWQLAELLADIPDLSFPKDGSDVGKSLLTIPKIRCKRIKSISLSASADCVTKTGDSFKWKMDCPIKILDGDKLVDELVVPHKDFAKDKDGNCVVPYALKLKSPCFDGATICYVSLRVTITYTDGGTSTTEMIVRAKKF